MRPLSIPWLVFLLFLPCAFPAWGAGFPSLSGPAAYTGELLQDGESYDVLLVLSEDRKFLLKENFKLTNGKNANWEAVGKWRQLGGGAFLQLSNQENFVRQINVGGAGNLYLSMQMPSGALFTVTLRLQKAGAHAGEFDRLAKLEATELKTGGEAVDRPLLLASADSLQRRESVERAGRRKKAKTALPSWRNAMPALKRWKSPDFAQREDLMPVAAAAKTRQISPTTAASAAAPRAFVPSWKDRDLMAALPALPAKARLASPASINAAALPPAVAKAPAPIWKDRDLLAGLLAAPAKKQASSKARKAPGPQLAARPQQMPVLPAAVLRGFIPSWKDRNFLAELPALPAPQKAPDKATQTAALAPASHAPSPAAKAPAWRDESLMTAFLAGSGQEASFPKFRASSRTEKRDLAQNAPSPAWKNNKEPVPFWKHRYMMLSFLSDQDRSADSAATSINKGHSKKKRAAKGPARGRARAKKAAPYKTAARS